MALNDWGETVDLLYMERRGARLREKEDMFL